MELDRDPERGEERRDSWGRLGGGETQEETRLSSHVFLLGSMALGWGLELVFSLIGIKRR